MAARFWYNINEQPNREGHQVYLLVSPGHYGRRLCDVHSNIELIKEQVEKGRLTYDPQKAEADPDVILLEENGEPEIEIGNTDFDKSVMRTMLDAKTSASRRTLEKRLDQAGFSAGLPTKF